MEDRVCTRDCTVSTKSPHSRLVHFSSSSRVVPFATHHTAMGLVNGRRSHYKRKPLSTNVVSLTRSTRLTGWQLCFTGLRTQVLSGSWIVIRNAAAVLVVGDSTARHSEGTKTETYARLLLLHGLST